jgi:hypothetical protein
LRGALATKQSRALRPLQDMLFGYRIENLLNNETICTTKLKGDEREYWTLFLDCSRASTVLTQGDFP